MQNGGKREGAGRKQGSINKVKLELRDAARAYTQAALETLVEIMNDHEAPHAARISAANSLLDRGHGKPTQSLDVDHTANISNLMVQWVKSNGNGEPA
ncbi:hypothetical protein SAMN02745130_01076 [Thiothrix eikelboomii]|uniref:Uncharacterized protein n=1 Tax=Thiothrix eikelboomii TaxID=92487 RepID=A0A1T4W5B1_9GAMM|nr:hypothetical protein [Thiothrix eikelboomii]SKA72446.1 hypothetical protein SAMN02745130_01076 [Thiothrix eikelboomii]